MYQGRPIIGIAGGIGSGKSFAARLLGDMGCYVIDSDAQVRQAYLDPLVRDQLREWWGDEVFTTAGAVDRSAVARRIFPSPAERNRLEGLIHPWVMAARDREMALRAAEPGVVAFVWDTPLLFEKGLNRACDCVVFVDADMPLRQARVAAERGWDTAELTRRENLQWTLDKKREIADYVVKNTADAGDLRGQLRDVLSRILTKSVEGSPDRSAGSQREED